MIREQHHSYKDYIVLVSCGDYTGTGFFIAPNLLCTCYHVLKNCNTEDILIKWKNEQYSVLDYSCHKDSDIAFLKTEGMPNNGWLPFVNNQDIKEGTDCLSFGYPDGYTSIGSPLSLKYTGSDIHSNILTFSGDNVTPGFSGSPIIDTVNSGLMAMLTISRDISNPSGGRGISGNQIFEALCHDLKFATFALQMLQLNEYFTLDECRWIKESHTIEHVVLLYLQDTLFHECSSASLSILDAYIRLIFDDNAFDKPYVAVARLIQNKFPALGTKYINWLMQKTTGPDEGQAKEAILFLQKNILPFPSKNVSKAENFCEQLKSARIAGSSCMKLFDLFSKSGKLKVPFHWTSNDIPKSRISLESTMIEYLKKESCFLVLANPGVGKSTLSKALFLDLVRQRKINQSRFIPLYIDLHKELINRECKFDATWLKNRLQQQYGKIDSIFLGELFENIIIILDGLDEYLDGMTKEETEIFFAIELFDCIYKYKIVITCRDQFYTRSVAGLNTQIDSFLKVVITSWENKSKVKYINQYVKLLRRKKRVNRQYEQADILGKIEGSPFLRGATDTPLYLNMTIEVLMTVNPRPIECIVDLYEQFAYNWTRNELQRISKYDLPNELIQDDPAFILNIIAAISWHYHELAFANRFSKLKHFRFSYREIQNYIQTEESEISLPYKDPAIYNKIAKFIAVHTFFISDSSLNLFFIHKSFYEYFSAKFLFDMLISEVANINSIVKVHASLLSPEVSELLKEHIKRIGDSRKMQHLFLENCKSSLAYLKQNYDNLQLNVPSKRIARQQIIYHIGLIKLKESSAYLKSILHSETDLWIKRGIIIGLSFSGDISELNSYIERLQAEVKQRKPWKENDVNIGFSLSFFGDQPYDNYAPDVDQQLPHCNNTVKRLLYQLSTEIDRPSWRSNLYTLVYLAHYRPISEKDYYNTMSAHKEETIKILDHLECDEKLIWPEIQQLRDIIKPL